MDTHDSAVKLSISLDGETYAIVERVRVMLRSSRAYALRHIIMAWSRYASAATEGEHSAHPAAQTPTPTPTAPPALYPLSAPAAPRAADAARPKIGRAHV